MGQRKALAPRYEMKVAGTLVQRWFVGYRLFPKDFADCGKGRPNCSSEAAEDFQNTRTGNLLEPQREPWARI